MSLNRPVARTALLAAAVLALGAGAGAATAAAPTTAGPTGVASAAVTPFRLTTDRNVNDRLVQPEDRYAVAGGCYTVEAPGKGYLAHDLTLGPAAMAVPLHFQATTLGEYLLATNEGRDTSVPGATWDVRSYLAAAGVAPAVPQAPAGPTLPAGSTLPGSAGLTLASAPSEDAEFVLVAAGNKADAKKQGQRYLLTSKPTGRALAVDGSNLTLADAGTPLALHHVADDNPKDSDANGSACANWPEIDTNATGAPKPSGKSPAAPVEGLFEAHVHGMAYEFLGGKIRCGSPWHKYGVEFALPDCSKTGNASNGALEVPLGGKSPSDPVTSYDPVGWPTFGYWPQHDTLTHEQYYWRWLERAYLGGLRLTTNLLVDNAALCNAYPVKKNSCNEMDGVRLQARRLQEFENYIDAQAGGPGEGWYRLVTTPSQARQVIQAGRLAVVKGIEISALFDCGEKLDVPDCTADQIDTRLQEVYDLGVRQMELVNKFDNALSGVTGDGGATGILVNNGQRQVSGHYWDMLTCKPEADHHDADEHDKTQSNVLDDTPGDSPEEIDALAGRVLSLDGLGKGIVAPAYGAGPHCNSRGLTALGKHLIKAMIGKGMMFDPDHMSALAQREALDYVQNELEPAERAAAAKAKRPAVVPALISSHSWGNDVIYQRIIGLDGVVAPRTSDAGSFADTWAKNVERVKKNAPKGYALGLGYGADTNGLGGQPGPRTKPKTPLVYTKDGFPAPIGGVRLFQQRSGVKSFDINRDGVAQYGLFADWYREVALAADEKHPGLGGGKAIVRDMLHGAESYLDLWERGVYGANSCVVDGSAPQVDDVNALVGGNVDGFLDAIGQPLDRTDDGFVYCALDAQGNPTTVQVGFDGSGTATSATPQGRVAPTVDTAAPRGGTLAATGVDGATSAYALLLLLGAGLLTAALRRRPA